MRRVAPRPLRAALGGALAHAEPATTIARVQSAWRTVAGAGLASAATPIAEREGVVTVACESAAWANELELLAPDLLERLNGALQKGGAGAVSRLRFVVRSGPNQG